MQQFAGRISKVAEATGSIRVVNLTYVGGTPDQVKTATVAVEVDGEHRAIQVESKTGPVDAIFNAIVQAVGLTCGVVLQKFQIDSVDEGSTSTAIARSRVAIGETVVIGEGRDVDTLSAAAKSFADAIDKLRSID